MKDNWVKGISKPWFDSNIMKAVKKRFLRIQLHGDHKRFKERNLVQQKEKKKKKEKKKTNFVRSPLEKSTKKSKELWKIFKNVGLPSEEA